MSTKQQCQRVAAKAKATFANRQKRNAEKPKRASTTRNSATAEHVKPKPQVQSFALRSEGVKPTRRRYTEAEWAEIRTNRNVRKNEAQEHKSAQVDVAQGGWATMGRGGKTSQVHQPRNTETKTVVKEMVSAPVSEPNKRGWAQVAYQPQPRKTTEKTSGAQLVLTGKRVASTSRSAARKVRGWVNRVSSVAGCTNAQAEAVLDNAVADCSGRPGSEMSRAVIAAAANRAIGVQTPTMVSGSHNAFSALGDQADEKTNFPSLVAKTKKVVSKSEPEKVAPKVAEIVVDTTGMDEIDAALALIDAEKRNKISRKVAREQAKKRKEASAAESPTEKPVTKLVRSAWSGKSSWIKNADRKIVPRTVKFAEKAKVFTFSEGDIAGSDEEWVENLADREYNDAVESLHPGYPEGMTDWGDQANWDDENGY